MLIFQIQYNGEQIQKSITNLIDWQLDQNAIKMEWIIKDFLASMDFINKIAQIAEKHNHHPEIFNVYNKVSLRFFCPPCERFNRS